MTETIKYTIKGQPTTIKKVATGIGMIAVVIIIIVDFLYTPLKSLPLELQVFAIGELIPRLFFDLNFTAIVLFFGSMMLNVFRWRSGTVKLVDKQIIIDGQVAVGFMMEKIKEINFIDSEFFIGNKRLIQIITADGVFKLKFKTDDTFEDFTEKLILAVGPYEDIKITSSIHTKPSDD